MVETVISLFDVVMQTVPDKVRLVQCSKATMVHVSHTIEDIVLRNRLPALMFTGFQESSHWKQETERYRSLVDVAQQVCIFAGKPLPEDHTGKVIQIELEGKDPLRQEWFVVILSSSFSVMLTGKDRQEPTHDENARLFDAILTFDPETIEAVVDRLEIVLTHYRPDVMPKLQNARNEFPIVSPDVTYVTSIMYDLFNYEETLQQYLREAYNEVQMEQDFMRRLIETSPAFFVATDAEGHITMVNPMLSQVIGTNAEGIKGELVWEALSSEDEHPRYFQAYEKLTTTYEPVTYTTQILTPDQTSLPVEWHSNVVWQDGELLVVFALGIDLRERQRMERMRREEERLRIELQKEREMNELRRQSLSTISHEFRTPLATILTATEVIERYSDRMDEETLQKRLETIKAQVDHLNNMVNDVALALNSEQGYLQFTPEPTDVEHLLEQVIQEVRLSMRTSHPFLFISEWDRSRIAVDPQLITYIVRNLLSNAVKYSPETESIRVRLREEDDYLIVAVEDNGIGIPKDAQDRIFDAFFRADNVGTRQGTGLGLNIVADAVSAHGGEMHYKSGESGTIFSVRLPIN